MLKDAGPDELIVLPEMFATGFSMRPEKIAQSMNGEIVSWMKENSRDKLICGTVAISEDGCFYNRFIACANGEIIAIYDKRHLFSYAGEDKHYTPGQSLTHFEYMGWNIKPLVCYDLRFPVWCRNVEKADLMLFCANWPEARIKAWDTLLTARAIENQCYVLGVNRVGADGNSKQYNGHTQLIDMLGQNLFVHEHAETTELVMLEKEKIHSHRNEFPFLTDADQFEIK
jgi:predicted amidohydrolase